MMIADTKVTFFIVFVFFLFVYVVFFLFVARRRFSLSATAKYVGLIAFISWDNWNIEVVTEVPKNLTEKVFFIIDLSFSSRSPSRNCGRWPRSSLKARDGCRVGGEDPHRPRGCGRSGGQVQQRSFFEYLWYNVLGFLSRLSFHSCFLIWQLRELECFCFSSVGSQQCSQFPKTFQPREIPSRASAILPCRDHLRRERQWPISQYLDRTGRAWCQKMQNLMRNTSYII